MVSLAARPKPVELAPARTALVIVDMQNAFGEKGGMFLGWVTTSRDLIACLRQG